MTDEKVNWAIYGLRLVDSPEYRYVGLTRIGLTARLALHKRDSHIKKPRHVLQWVAKHENDIVIDLLEECPEGDTDYLFEAEQFWITQIRGFGHNLTNLSDGGASGSYGARWKLRPEQIRRGENHPMYGTKANPDHIKRLAELRKGTKLSEETRKKMSESRSGEKHWAYGGGKITEETRKKISETLRGKPMPSSKRSSHTRWHTNKNVSKPETCNYCKEAMQ